MDKKIRPEELRIGNKFLHNGNWSYRSHSAPTIITWEERDWYALGECTISLEDIRGIPLSEEWLIRGGFEVGDNSSWLEKGILAVSKSGSIAFKMEGKWVNHPRKMGYVHDIQNLWKSLTGEELKFNDQST